MGSLRTCNFDRRTMMGDLATKKNDRRGRTNPWRTGRQDRPRHNNPVWALAKQLSLEVYRLTDLLPTDERFGLRTQIRRASVSVMSNIAEGSARRTTKSYIRFLYNARASLEEVDTQLELAGDLGYLVHADLDRAIETFENLSKALQGLINAMNRKVGRS
jgi:four helix bundle protein